MPKKLILLFAVLAIGLTLAACASAGSEAQAEDIRGIVYRSPT